jgi:hypothetical protein
MLNPDSAVGADRKRAAKSTGFCLSACIDQRRFETSDSCAYLWSFAAPIRLANAAGEAMARDKGTIRALMTMRPQMPTE